MQLVTDEKKKRKPVSPRDADIRCNLSILFCVLRWTTRRAHTLHFNSKKIKFIKFDTVVNNKWENMTCQKIHPAGSLHDFSYESINVENRHETKIKT